MDIVLRTIGNLLIISAFAACFVGGYQYALHDNGLVEMPIPMKIAHNLNSESGYNVDTWDCSNMSEELVIRLVQQGYGARYAPVKLYDTCHAIVQYTQYIEATTGRFVNPNIDTDYSFNRTGCRYDDLSEVRDEPLRHYMIPIGIGIFLTLLWVWFFVNYDRIEEEDRKNSHKSS